MNDNNYDVIVIGLGAMGAAAIYQLSKSGVKVLGIDQYEPPHRLGSSHGDTRITRLAVGEGSDYAPLVKRSHEIWQEIEAKTGRKLLSECGGLIMAIDDSQGQHGVKDFVGQTTAIAVANKIAHEVLSNKQIHARFPAFNISTEHGYYEAESGYVIPEECLRAQLQLAVEQGATIKANEAVTKWVSNGDSVEVTTENGLYVANKLIIAAGPWISALVPELKTHFKVYRQVLYWFDIADKAKYEQYRDMPVYIWVYGNQPDDYIYGFPAIDGPNGGIKLACEDYAEETSPETVDRSVSEVEIAGMYEKHVKYQFPGVNSKCIKAQAFLYTVTPDFKFVIDFHPDHDNVIVASPCSGHGFKHSAAIGEVLSELATKGNSQSDISSFSFERLM